MEPNSDSDDPRDEASGEDVEEDARIEGALRQAVREALLQHKRAGNSIVVYRHGEIVDVPPEDIEIAIDPPSPAALPSASR